MSTRSAIVIQTGTETFKGVYCHFDGYPGGVGVILRDRYADRAKVEQLIALGDLSHLEREMNPDPSGPHTFNDPQPDVTVAYGRDRGETGTEPKEGDLSAVLSRIDHEYAYVFGLDGQWRMSDGQLLVNAIAKEGE